MDTWILHIQIEDSVEKKDKSHISNRYSTWASEKQALKAAGLFIKEELFNWYLDAVLLHSACALVDRDMIPLAIKLINTYSQFDATGEHSKTKLKQFHFSIIKSTFLGSAFE